MSGRTQSAGLIPGATSDGIRTRNSVLIEVLFTANGSVWWGGPRSRPFAATGSYKALLR